VKTWRKLFYTNFSRKLKITLFLLVTGTDQVKIMGMRYSCGYFCSPEDSLYQAQLQKIDYILKKLQLHPEESVLNIGWGWLIIRAPQQYGN